MDALQHRSKDLQIASWLTEAWLHLYGLAGLREGLRALTGLCEAFWDNLYPQSESGDSIEYRIAPVEWVNDKLAPVVRLLPLTEPESDDVKAYCWDDWESATRPKAADSPNQGATQAQFQKSALLTPSVFYSDLLKEVESAADGSAELESVLEQKCGSQAPSLRQLANTLDSIRGLIVSILNRRDPLPPAPAAVRSPEPARETPQQAPPTEFGVGPIRSRDEAYQRLAEVADYLSRTEPHSPTPYLIRRAIAWGGMRLEDLLPELVRNNAELGDIFRLLQMGKAGEK